MFVFSNDLTRHIKPFTGTDIHMGVTNDVSLVTAAKDIAYLTNSKYSVLTFVTSFHDISIISRTVRSRGEVGARRILGNHLALLHVYVDARASNHQSLIAAAIDCTDSRGRDNVNLRVAMRYSQRTALSFLERNAALNLG